MITPIQNPIADVRVFPISPGFAQLPKKLRIANDKTQVTADLMKAYIHKQIFKKKNDLVPASTILNKLENFFWKTVARFDRDQIGSALIEISRHLYPSLKVNPGTGNLKNVLCKISDEYGESEPIIYFQPKTSHLTQDFVDFLNTKTNSFIGNEYILSSEIRAMLKETFTSTHMNLGSKKLSIDETATILLYVGDRLFRGLKDLNPPPVYDFDDGVVVGKTRPASALSRNHFSR